MTVYKNNLTEDETHEFADLYLELNALERAIKHCIPEDDEMYEMRRDAVKEELDEFIKEHGVHKR